MTPLILAALATAQTPMLGFSGENGIGLSARNQFSMLTPLGYAPVVVRIENRSEARRRWVIRTRASRGWGTKDVFTSQREVEVGPGMEKEVDVLAPLPGPSERSGTMRLQVEIEGYGVRRGSATLSGRIPNAYDKERPFVGLSASLEAKDKDRFAGNSAPIFAVKFDPADMPIDWRAFAGLDALWMTPADIELIEEAAHRALLDWVLQGGQIVVCLPPGETAKAPYGLRTPSGVFGAYGFGALQTMRWDGVGITNEVEHSARGVRAQDKVVREQNAFFKFDGNMVNRTLMLAFLLAFGVLIGPVNIFYLAKRSRRMRLLWTTPMISVGASVALAVLILAEDGVGGHGRRTVVALVMPDDNREVLLQEQTSRTGVLLSGRFPATDGAFLDQIHLGDGFGTRSYMQADGRHAGDFFRTRTVQAQRIRSVRGSRSRVRWLGDEDGRPRIASELPVPVELIYIDPGHRAWTATGVKPGEQVTLAPTDSNDVATFVDAAVGGRVTDVLMKRLDRNKGTGGWFIARADELGPMGVGTHPALSWKDDRLLVVGPVMGAPR